MLEPLQLLLFLAKTDTCPVPKAWIIKTRPARKGSTWKVFVRLSCC